MLLVFFTSNILFAQQMKNPTLKTWEGAISYTLEVAKAMPKELYSFKATGEEMTFAEQLQHITSNLYGLGSRFIEEKGSVGSVTISSEKEIVIEELEKSFNYVRQMISDRTESDWLKEVTFFTGELLTKEQVLGVMRDHMTHHRAQLVVYLRLNNITPPRYRGW